ncbi:Crp/Fnr family transcriptional regulator [Synechococcus sp. CS-1328]|uniref:Crp/Fnr family transcriptional regulator n=1 Tax=Synechococcus sp. CS-1328 TaxID=2847976 RepID=UPI00223A9C97|nr:Crp/Fnr family transcriptional regulator [Synechococcus sp. CS-1328]MCT0224105.1 Crp/Fnr family transcriptional regulator [Synechococcus sp. CS-1328]
MPVPLSCSDLARLPLFQGIDAALLEPLLEGQLSVSLPADQVVVMEEDEGMGLLVLRSGMAKVRGFSADGEEVTLAVLGPEALLGDMAVLVDGRRTADVVALTALQVVKLRSEPFRRLLEREGRLALAMARLQARRLRALNQRFLLRGADATTRLLAALLELALQSDPARDPEALVPPLPQRELAAIAGLSRETASRSLSQLRRQGTVSCGEEGMRITNLAPLRKRGLWH